MCNTNILYYYKLSQILFEDNLNLLGLHYLLEMESLLILYFILFGFFFYLDLTGFHKQTDKQTPTHLYIVQ